MSFYSPSVLGQVFLCHFCEWEKRIRRVLDRKEQVKRDGSFFGFASSVWAFSKEWPSLRLLSSGSWVVSNHAKSGKLNSVPKPRNSPMSTSKTSGTTWMMSVWRNSSINTVTSSGIVVAWDSLLFCSLTCLFDFCPLQGRRSVWRSWQTRLANPEASDSLVMRNTRTLTRYFALVDIWYYAEIFEISWETHRSYVIRLWRTWTAQSLMARPCLSVGRRRR